MAQYTATQTPTDLWLQDGLTGEQTRAATLAIRVKYDFVPDGRYSGIQPESWAELHWTIPGQWPEAFRKKRLLSRQMKVWVRDKSLSASGALPNGSYAHVCAEKTMPFRAFMMGDWRDRFQDAEALAPNSYCPAPLNGMSLWAGCSADIYSQTRYRFDDRVTVDGLTGAKPPYLELQFEDVIPQTEGEYPWRGFVNEKAEAEFGWRLTCRKDGILELPVQRRAYVDFRAYGSTEYTTYTVEGPLGRITMAAGTLPAADRIQWRVRVQTEDGVWSQNEPWYTLTTVDSTPDAAKPVSPDGIYVDGAGGIPFRWEHLIATGTAPSVSELERGTDGVNWEPLASAPGPALVWEAPAGSLSPGNLFWRVRTANSDGVWGNWSEAAQAVVYGPPAAPVISGVSNTARPVVRWQAEIQSGYALEISRDGGTVYELPERSGTEKEHRVTAYLEDGGYQVRLRVKGGDGIWSSWGTAGFTIRTAKPAVPQVRVSAEPYRTRVEVAPQVRKNLFVHTAELPMTVNGLTLDYDRVSGEYVLNGTIQSEWTRLVLALCPFQWKNGQLYSMSVQKTAGTVTAVGEKDIVIVAEAYQNGAQLAERFFVDTQLVGGQTWFAQSYTAPPTAADQVYVFLDPWFCKGNGFTNYRIELQLEEGPPTVWESGTALQPAKRYLLRDGEPVAKLDGLEYLDYTALGARSYVVRAVSDSDSFADSAPVTAEAVVPSGAVLAPADAPGELHPLLLRRGAKPSASGTLEMAGELVRLAGRRFPVCEFREQESEALTLAFTVRDRARWEALRELAGSRRPLLYRDASGNRCYGVIRSLTRTQDRFATDFTAVFDRVDYVERIEYDPP